jgi:hypothetical protein
LTGPAAPALAALVILVVVLASMLGLVEVPGQVYAGLFLVLAGLAALAWGREADE